MRAGERPRSAARSAEFDPIIDAFAAREEPGAFAGAERAEVAQGLRRRLADPSSLDQGAATFSGAAAFVHCLIGDAPQLYLQYVIDLFERGSARIGELQVAPGASCRECTPAAAQIAAVDWIALASLRDAEREIAGWEDADDTGVPTTTPETLANWLGVAGYRHIRNDADRFFAKGARETSHLRDLFAQGRRLCLYISADMLVDGGAKSRTLRPNQWSVLTAPVALSPQGIVLRLYQWGAQQRVPPVGEMAADRFCRHFYGFVAAMPPSTPRPAC